jgi:hypothetical protein
VRAPARSSLHRHDVTPSDATSRRPALEHADELLGPDWRWEETPVPPALSQTQLLALVAECTALMTAPEVPPGPAPVSWGRLDRLGRLSHKIDELLRAYDRGELGPPRPATRRTSPSGRRRSRPATDPIESARRFG